LACCAATLAACGSSGGGSGNGFSGTPRQLLSDAQSALRQAHGFAVSGSITENGTLAQVSFSSDAKGSLSVSAAFGGRSFSVISIAGGGTYLKGDQAFWVSASVGSAAASLAGHWITFPAASASKLTSSLGVLEPTNLPRCLGEDLGTLGFAGKTNVNGVSAITIHDDGNVPGSARGDLDVASGTPHYPLRLTNTSGEKPGGTVDVCNDGKGSDARGALTFSAFGHVPTIAAPAHAQTIPGA
jgi:hypothetical protein